MCGSEVSKVMLAYWMRVKSPGQVLNDNATQRRKRYLSLIEYMKNIDSILQAGKSIKTLLGVFQSLFLFVPKCADTLSIGKLSSNKNSKQSKIALSFCFLILIGVVILVVVFTTPSTQAREYIYIASNNTGTVYNIPPYWGQSDTHSIQNRQIATYDTRNRDATCKVLLKSNATESGYMWTTCYSGMPSNAPQRTVLSDGNNSAQETAQNNKYNTVRRDVPYLQAPQSVATQPRVPNSEVAYNRTDIGRSNAQPAASTLPYWKERDQLARSMVIQLPSGAHCKRYATSEYGCFPLPGRPLHYKWHSYSKGTLLDGGFTASQDHRAIDIYAPHHTPVFSVWDGVVRSSYHDPNGIGGNTVIIEHSQEHVATVYVHLQYRGVKAGDIVKAGQVIGSVGSTGRTPNSHLHFRVHDMDKESYQISKLAPLTEYEVVSLAPFRGIRKGNFHGEHLVEHL